MSMGMEVGIFLAYAMGMLLVYLTGRYMLIPLKWIGGLLVNSLLGGIIIFLINSLGSGFGLFVPLNAITAVLAGILGIPGIVMLLIFFL